VLFAAPAVVEWSAARDGMAGLIYWVAGLGGMYFARFLLALARDPWGAFQRWRNGGAPGAPGAGGGTP
jgi:hypothetical protein